VLWLDEEDDPWVDENEASVLPELPDVDPDNTTAAPELIPLPTADPWLDTNESPEKEDPEVPTPLSADPVSTFTELPSEAPVSSALPLDAPKFAINPELDSPPGMKKDP